MNCVGSSGDPAGSILKDAPPNMKRAPFVKLNLSCSSTLESTNAAQMAPGMSFVGACPANCRGGFVEGSEIYSQKSSICGAAIHAGIINNSKGGEIMATVGHGQRRYFGSLENGVESKNSVSRNNSDKSLVISLPTFSVLSRVAETYSEYIAGASVNGSPIVPKLMAS